MLCTGKMINIFRNFCFYKVKMFNFSGHLETRPYAEKIQFLLMYMFQHEQLFTHTDVCNYTVQASETMLNMESQTFFWTRSQRSLIENNEKRVLLTSDFGTGKTILLKAMAKKILPKIKEKEEPMLTKFSSFSKRKEKIFFILFTAPNSLLTISVQNEFKEWKDHIEVSSFCGREKEIIVLVRNNPGCHFFLDEVLVNKNSFTTETIAEMSKIISKSSYLWISFVSDKLPVMEDDNLKGLLKIKFNNKNLRH